jgi:hypothetical protein
LAVRNLVHFADEEKSKAWNEGKKLKKLILILEKKKSLTRSAKIAREKDLEIYRYPSYINIHQKIFLGKSTCGL